MTGRPARVTLSATASSGMPSACPWLSRSVIASCQSTLRAQVITSARRQLDMTLVRSSFTIDAVEAFEGWYDPDVRWNGFACPLFEREEADRVASAFGLRYAEADDAYSDDTDMYVGTERQGLHLYAIGAQGWTWLDKDSELGSELWPP